MQYTSRLQGMVVEPEMERAGGVWGECLCRVVITALGEWIENRRFLKTVHQHPCSARPEGRVELHGWNMEAVGKHFFSRGSVALFFPDCQSILEESESLRFIRKWIFFFFFFFFDGAFFFFFQQSYPSDARVCEAVFLDKPSSRS